MKYDFIIIGTGAGGGTIASKLARSGAKILVLERGGWLPREQQNWDTSEVFVKNRYVSRDPWTINGKVTQPGTHYYVGGATKLYGAALYRLRPGDFGEVRHVDGTSPAWPLTYDDMEPYYTAAEWMYEVHGNHGEDPTEGNWTEQYLRPPVSHSPRIQRLSDDLARAGYHPFHAPSAVLLNERRPELSACTRCNTCDGHPCLVGAKADAEAIGIRPVLDLPNVTLLTNTQVLGLIADHGHVSEVSALHNGRVQNFWADTVILAAGAANTAKILLSTPGLANSSDQVGRNYMFHNSRAVMAIDSEPNATVFQKTLGLNDFYWADPEHGREFPLGNLQMVGKSCAAAMRSESKLAAIAPEMPLREIARHSVDFWLTTEDLPLPQNRVTLDAGGNVKLDYRKTNQAEADGLYGKLREIMRNLGMRHHYVFEDSKIGLAGVAHQAGTARMGNDPATSVVDVNCKAHGLDNLYIADASVFPSIGSVNPALTVMANALRVGDHLLEG